VRVKDGKGVHTQTFNGLTLTLRDWAEHSGIPLTCLRKRLHKGWTFKDAVTTPVKRSYKGKRVRKIKGRIQHNGRSGTIVQWARRLNMAPNTLRWRLYRGWSVKDALEVPIQGVTRSPD
jgi:hypothetical protein